MTALLPPLRLVGATLLREGELQKRSLVIEDGVVTHAAIEAPMKFEVSSAEAILAAL